MLHWEWVHGNPVPVPYMQQLHDLRVAMLIACPVQERVADHHLKGVPCQQHPRMATMWGPCTPLVPDMP